MSTHARIEEISSSEEDSDPEIMDPSSLAVLEPVRPRQQPSAPAPQTFAPSNPMPQQQSLKTPVPKADHTWITLYPLYFDASATRAQGRRVGSAQAVRNPLAKTLADAAAQYVAVPASLLRGANRASDEQVMRAVQQRVILEPGKRHPADWANPGRVRVKVRDEEGDDGWSMGDGIKNKRMLYKAISSYMQKHPTTASDPFDLPVRGMPMPQGDEVPAPAKPRGWRLNDILPLHSAAMTGGGVSDNIMKDLQAAMGGPGGPGGMGGGDFSQLAALAGGAAGNNSGTGSGTGQAGRIEAKKKKDKKKK